MEDRLNACQPAIAHDERKQVYADWAGTYADIKALLRLATLSNMPFA